MHRLSFSRERLNVETNRLVGRAAVEVACDVAGGSVCVVIDGEDALSDEELAAEGC